MSKVFIYTIPRESAYGIHTWTDENSNRPLNKTKVGKLTQDQLRKIAETKMPDLNAASVESAMRMIAGTARSMGVTIVE